MKQQAQPMQVMFSILERGKGTDFIAHYQAFQVPLHIHTTGRGTAASHLLDTLGFATEERDILISVGTKNAVRQLMRHLHDEDRSKLGVRGIACSFSVNGMNSALAIGLSGSQEEEAAGEGISVEQEVIEELSMKEALEKLDSKEREIVHLKIMGEMTFQEIAGILAMPLGTVTWKYQNALKKLRRCGYHE